MYKNEEDLPFILTKEEIQTILRVGDNTTYKIINSGEFPVFYVGKQIRILKNEFLKWLYEKNGIAS
ncbi:helix-turn-helix domain-containing protein [Virgibacillus dakarensis]|nr:helix-turn-helix domain-containing protein [Virgibacillus dakarensis]